MENIHTPKTPREMALCDEVKELKRELAQHKFIPHTTYFSSDTPRLSLGHDHPEFLRLANVKATNRNGHLEAVMHAFTADPLISYEASEYILAEQLMDASPTSALAYTHEVFLRKLAYDLKEKK